MKSLKEGWPDWIKKLVQVANLESTRPAIRKLIKDLDEVPGTLDNEDGMSDRIVYVSEGANV